MANCPNCGFSIADHSCEFCGWSEHFDYAPEDGAVIGCDTAVNGQLFCEQCLANMDEDECPCPNYLNK